MTYTELKELIKTQAVKIKELKGTRKSVSNGYVAGLDRLRYEARHHHIVHCLLRGRLMENIEKPAEGNEANDHYIEQIMKSVVFPPKEEVIKEVQNEKVVCSCS
jgi:hypothetical protein